MVVSFWVLQPCVRLLRLTCSVLIIYLPGAQALLGYIVMLATMTFSVELLACVILGLSLGYGIFFKPADVFLENPGHVTTNPCCAFMEEEVKDLRSMELDEDLASSAPSTTVTDTPTVEPSGSGLRYRNPV